MIDYNNLIQWLFYGIVGGSCVALVSLLKHLLTTQIEMNMKITAIMEKHDHHERWLEMHEKDIRILRGEIG